MICNKVNKLFLFILDETDQLLNKIGMFEIVTKDESGNNYYKDLCK